jgi:hypothetical protein
MRHVLHKEKQYIMSTFLTTEESIENCIDSYETVPTVKHLGLLTTASLFQTLFSQIMDFDTRAIRKLLRHIP